MEMFVSIDSMLEIKDGGRQIVLCHYPMAEWRNSRRTAWHIYGHIHNRRSTTYKFMRTVKNSLNAAASVNTYRPVTFTELIAYNKCFNDETDFTLDGEPRGCVEQNHRNNAN